VETSGKRLFVRGGDCGSNCLFFVWFLFLKIGGSCDCWWENKRAGVSFFKKKIRRQVLVRLLEGGKRKERSVRA
jgi:hypothetical protein